MALALNVTPELKGRARLGVLALHDAKTGPRNVPLSAPALAVLDDLDHVEGCPYLIVSGARPGRHVVNLAKAWAAITCTAELEGVTLHTLRHTHASVGVDEGLSLPVVGKLLGHSQSATTQRYAHVDSLYGRWFETEPADGEEQ